MCELFETAPEDVFVLPSAKFKFRKDKRGRLSKLYTPQGLARAISFVEEAREAELPEDRSEYDDLISAVQEDDLSIDSEAFLFAATAGFDDFVLITGDKRAIKALWSASGCDSIKKRLAGRCRCFEQIVVLLIGAVGFEFIVIRISPALACDGVLRLCFSNGSNSDPKTVLEGLASYIRDLRSHTGDLLSPEN